MTDKHFHPDNAACRTLVEAGAATVDDWMPTTGMTAANWRAVLTCNEDCPVRDACAEHAIRHNEVGIWGGLTAKGRRAARVARRKGGPVEYRHTVNRSRQRANRLARIALAMDDVTGEDVA